MIDSCSIFFQIDEKDLVVNEVKRHENATCDLSMALAILLVISIAAFALRAEAKLMVVYLIGGDSRSYRPEVFGVRPVHNPTKHREHSNLAVIVNRCFRACFMNWSVDGDLEYFRVHAGRKNYAYQMNFERDQHWCNIFNRFSGDAVGSRC